MIVGSSLSTTFSILWFLSTQLLLHAKLVPAAAAASGEQGAMDRGKAGCPCVDVESIIKENYPNRRCSFKNGTVVEEGTLFNEGKDCYPFNFGSSQCLQWETVVNEPVCIGVAEDPPQYCLEPWCYVDKDICHSSNVTFYKSKSYNELYWSYSTCGGDERSWLKKETTQSLEGRTLRVALANMWYPVFYKEDNHSNVLKNGNPAVYDQSLPWRGVVIDYFDDLLLISNIEGAKYRHRSGGSSHKKIVSKATQTVSDVGAGIADVAIGTFWVTAERLEIVPFTVPVITDTFKLWVPRSQAAVKQSMADNLNRLRQPFSDQLWLVLIFAILVNAILSGILSPKKFRTFDRKANSIWGKIQRIIKIMTDSLNLSCLEFLGGGLDTAAVDQNLSQKMLNIGFAVVVFVAVTAYTANLAAFLTIGGAATMISNLEEATAAGMVVCANYNLRNELRALYPKTNFLFGPDNKNVQELYEQEKCSAIVQGWVDIRIEPDAQTWYCNHQLARVGPKIIEFQIAFPSTSELVGGLSHWVAEAKKRGLKFENYLERVPLSCPLEVGDAEINEIALMTQQFSLQNMVVPLMFFLVAAGGAVSIHLFKIWYYRKGNERNGGRHMIRTSLGLTKPFPVDTMSEAFESNACRATDHSDLSLRRKGQLPTHGLHSSTMSLEKRQGLHSETPARKAKGACRVNAADSLLEEFLMKQRQTMEEQRLQAMKELEEFVHNSLQPSGFLEDEELEIPAMDI